MGHVAILLLLPNPYVLSNLLQEAAALLAIGVCLLRRAQCPARSDRILWLQLGCAFALWAIAQGVYTFQLSLHSVSLAPSLTDVLWLAFAFPLLLIAAQPRRESRLQPLGWLDTAQAGLFFSVLFALVFQHPSGISLGLAYDVQSLAMVLTIALRYTSTEHTAERGFFLDLFLYAMLYAGFSTIGYMGPLHHMPQGGVIDACWSAPFLGFNLLVLMEGRSPPARSPSSRSPALPSPAKLSGISSLGLAVMSMVAAVVLSHHDVLPGSIAAVAAFGLFAVRTTVRESQLHQTQRRLEHATMFDALTGLPNRAQMQRLLQDHLDRQPLLENEQSSVLSMDLDRFQTINDGLGHSFGDLVLVEIARRLEQAIPSTGTVGRHGGDEFMVVLQSTTEQQASACAADLLQQLRQPLHLDGRVMYISASLGFVLGSAETNAESMLRDADCAMDRAKALGKDRAERFQPSMRSAIGHTLRLEADLREALDAQALEVQYQPIYALPSRSIVGFEALARWNHPEFGSISPADFIPVAEETGLIMPLGKQVLRDACFRLQAWNATYKSSLTVNVNVSARQFDDPNLLADIAQALRDARLPPNLLKLEITESALLAAHSSVQAVLDGARALGIRICLDDFGTGYSSLSYLLYHPFDVVKIDQSFVRHLDHDSVKIELVRTVIGLAANLKKDVIAEGVESSEEIATLTSLNCHMVQGYFLSRPLAPDKVEDLLEQTLPHRRDLLAAATLTTASLQPRDPAARRGNLLPPPVSTGRTRAH